VGTDHWIHLLALHTPGASMSWAVRWCSFKGRNTLLASSHCHVWILPSCKFHNVDRAWGWWEEHSNTEKITVSFITRSSQKYSFKTSLSLQSPWWRCKGHFDMVPKGNVTWNAMQCVLGITGISALNYHDSMSLKVIKRAEKSKKTVERKW